METKCIVQHIGTIAIENGIVIGDPCYNGNDIVSHGISMAGKEMQSGIYDCYVGWVNEGDCWGNRVAFMEIVRDGERFKLSYGEFLGSCSVDSGTLMISDRTAWEKNHKEDSINDEWYDKNIVAQCNKDEDVYIFDDGNSFLSESGLGDGCYDVFGDSDKDGKLIRMMAEFILPDEEDGFDILDFIEADQEPDFSWY